MKEGNKVGCFLVLILLVVSIGIASAAESCEITADCESGEKCVDETCVPFITITQPGETNTNLAEENPFRIKWDSEFTRQVELYLLRYDSDGEYLDKAQIELNVPNAIKEDNEYIWEEVTKPAYASATDKYKIYIVHENKAARNDTSDYFFSIGEEECVPKYETSELGVEVCIENCECEEPSEISSIRHNADDIQVNINGKLYSLQDYVDGNTEGGWQDGAHDIMHYARDVRIVVDDNKYTLQSYIENRKIRWNRVTHFSWEEGSAVSIKIEDTEYTIQEAIDEGLLLPNENGGDSGDECENDVDCDAGEVCNDNGVCVDEGDDKIDWFYRCYNNKNYDHMISKHEDCETGAYSADEISFEFFAEELAGTVPLYRCFNIENGDHMISLNEDCGGDVTGYSVEKEGEPYAYIYDYNSPKPDDTVAIYRCWNSKLEDHMVSDEQDCETTQYTNDGPLGYANVGDAGADVTDEEGEIVKNGNTIVLKSVINDKYLSINSDEGSMTNGLNANRDEIEDENEKFIIEVVDDDTELVDEKKVKLKSVSSNMNIEYLTAKRCSSLRAVVSPIYCASLLILYPGYEWVHAHSGEDSSNLFSQKIVKIESDGTDDKIRYGDTIAFNCGGKSCFRVSSLYDYKPVYRLQPNLVVNFNKWDESVQFIVCDETGDCGD